ncbi:MAG: nitric oxide reductase activation protein NorD [Polynucleobacter sp.]
MSEARTIQSETVDELRQRLDCRFTEVDGIFTECLIEAHTYLSTTGVLEYIDQARVIGKLGRGVEPLLNFLQEWPAIAHQVGESALPSLASAIQKISKSPNGKSIALLIAHLPPITRRLPSQEQLDDYLRVAIYQMDQTSISIHGIHKTYASPSFHAFIESSAKILDVVTVGGLEKWVEYGIRNYSHHPEQQIQYFQLESADSLAVLKRQRHGTLLIDNTRQLELYTRSFWEDGLTLVPYSTGFNSIQMTPYFDEFGARLPDVYDDVHDIKGINRYRIALAHMLGHKRWSQAIFADNFSPLQRIAIECFEDSKIDYLICQQYPGLRKLMIALHPRPDEFACDPKTESCIRHRLSMLSYAILDEHHSYDNEDVATFRKIFLELIQDGKLGTSQMAELALEYVAKTRLQTDQLPNTIFENTEIEYRDDNRHLWKFHELSDDEEMFEQAPPSNNQEDIDSLPPRLYDEWNYNSESYRPDWVSVYERLQPLGQASVVDQILNKHSALIKRLKKVIDALKPQNKTRVRYQENGSELDLDVAISSLINLKSGHQPELRINTDHETNDRNIAVLLLLDLSQSLNETVAGTNQTVLSLSQEAATMLAYVTHQLNDSLAIAGFHSNTRHEVSYMHIKGFSETWDDSVKARLANIEAKYSTRMGAAMRHASHYLQHQHKDKKILLVLTDGEPSDVDIQDQDYLKEDAKQAVRELAQKNIYSYCINLDKKADDYVKDIFSHQFSVIEKIEQLPEKLPKLFLSLTK